MKRTLKDIERHSAFLRDAIESLHRKMDGMGEEERDFLMRELTITGLSVIGIKHGTLAYDKTIEEASSRVIEYCDNSRSSEEVNDGKTKLIANGSINPKFRAIH